MLLPRSRHKAFSYGLAPNIADRDSSNDTAFGFPGMNCMLSRVGVRFVENGAKDLAPASTGGNVRDRPEPKATQTINVTDIGDDHLQALEAACMEHYQALTPFVCGQRPLQELARAENRAMETEIHNVALQQFLDILCAYSEVLQLQGRVDDSLRCILSSIESVDQFLSAHVVVASPSSVVPSASLDPRLVEKVDSIIFTASYLEKLGRSGFDYWWHVGLTNPSLTKYLADLLKRVGVLLRLSGQTYEAYCVVKVALELYKQLRPNSVENITLVATTTALQVSILLELGEEVEAASVERAALEMVAASALLPRRYPSSSYEE